MCSRQHLKNDAVDPCLPILTRDDVGWSIGGEMEEYEIPRAAGRSVVGQGVDGRRTFLEITFEFEPQTRASILDRPWAQEV